MTRLSQPWLSASERQLCGRRLRLIHIGDMSNGARLRMLSPSMPFLFSDFLHDLYVFCGTRAWSMTCGQAGFGVWSALQPKASGYAKPRVRLWCMGSLEQSMSFVQGCSNSGKVKTPQTQPQGSLVFCSSFFLVDYPCRQLDFPIDFLADLRLGLSQTGGWGVGRRPFGFACKKTQNGMGTLARTTFICVPTKARTASLRPAYAAGARGWKQAATGRLGWYTEATPTQVPKG